MTMKTWILAGAAALALATTTEAATPLPPSAIYTDPPADIRQMSTSEKS